MRPFFDVPLEGHIRHQYRKKCRKKELNTLFVFLYGRKIDHASYKTYMGQGLFTLPIKQQKFAFNSSIKSKKKLHFKCLNLYKLFFF